MRPLSLHGRLLLGIAAGVVLTVTAWGAFGAAGQVELGVPASFQDVPQSHPYFAAVEHMRTTGVIQGYPDGTFRPDAPISRAEMVKFIVTPGAAPGERERCVLDPEMIPLFTDIPDPTIAWYGPFVCAAKRLGFVGGYPDGNFRPGNRVTIAETAKIVTQVFGIEPTSPVDEPWYAGPLIALNERQLLPETFNAPEQFTTRGELAEMLYRILQLYPLPARGAPLSPEDGTEPNIDEQAVDEPANPDEQSSSDGPLIFDLSDRNPASVRPVSSRAASSRRSSVVASLSRVSSARASSVRSGAASSIRRSAVSSSFPAPRSSAAPVRPASSRAASSVRGGPGGWRFRAPSGSLQGWASGGSCDAPVGGSCTEPSPRDGLLCDYRCPGYPDVLSPPQVACGDGITDAGEQCDLGPANGKSWTACTSVCAHTSDAACAAQTQQGEKRYGRSYAISMSPDARYVVFDADYQNLRGLFLRDRVSGTTEAIEGAPSTGSVNGPIVSADGRLILWLTQGNPLPTLHTYDRLTKTIDHRAMSVPSTPDPSTAASFAAPMAMTDDARYVLFHWRRDVNAANLFVYDRQLSTLRPVIANGTPDQGSTFLPMSGAFSPSFGLFLQPDDTFLYQGKIPTYYSTDGTVSASTGRDGIVTYDGLVIGQGPLLSLSGDGKVAGLYSKLYRGDDSGVERPPCTVLWVSRDAKTVVCRSRADLLSQDYNASNADVYAYDRPTQKMQLVSVGPGGEIGFCPIPR